MSTEKCFSLDNEEFNFREFWDMLESMDDPKVGDTYYEADCVRLSPTDGVNKYSVDHILESMDERIYEDIGECYGNEFLDVSDEAKAELLALLEDWSIKHVDLSMYWRIVGKTRECKLTADDLRDEEAQ